MSLEEYRKLVRSLAFAHDGQLVSNESIEHASVVIEHLFGTAMKSIDVLSGEFNEDVYGRDEVVREAKLFLGDSDQNKIRIILEKTFSESLGRHSLFRACSGYKNLQVKLVPPEVQNRYNFHFVLVDSDSYRFEEDKSQPQAVVAFGDETGASNLRSIHSELWETCKSLPEDWREWESDGGLNQ